MSPKHLPHLRAERVAGKHIFLVKDVVVREDNYSPIYFSQELRQLIQKEGLMKGKFIPVKVKESKRAR